MLLIIIWYFFHNYVWPRPWPQPPEIGFGLGLVALVSASASRFWPRLTSLVLLHTYYLQWSSSEVTSKRGSRWL